MYHDRLQIADMLTSDRQLIYSPGQSHRQLHRMRTMITAMMEKMPVYFLPGKRVQVNGENAFIYIIKLYPELFLQHQVRVYGDSLRAMHTGTGRFLR